MKLFIRRLIFHFEFMLISAAEEFLIIIYLDVE